MRDRIRSVLLRCVEWESPRIAAMQSRLRCSWLDLLCVQLLTAMGTHTFFLVGLPLCFWFGDVVFARHLTLMLAIGVMLTGFFKDLFCLPRPMAPPVLRLLHQQGSYHAFEYGLPSTHSANAASICVFLALYYGPQWAAMDSAVFQMAIGTLWLSYAVLLPLSRVYCGMHSLTDITFGLCLGSTVTLVDWFLAFDTVEAYFAEGGSVLPVLAAVLLFLTAVHPDPKAPCPCFDDSASFAGVLLGLVAGALRNQGASPNPPGSQQDLRAVQVTVRILVGTVCLALWRTVAKSVLLGVLRPIWIRNQLPLVYHTLPLGDNKGEDAVEPLQDCCARSETFSSAVEGHVSEVLRSRREVKGEHLLSPVTSSTTTNEETPSTTTSTATSQKDYYIPRHSLDIWIKLAVYTGIGWLATDLLPAYVLAHI